MAGTKNDIQGKPDTSKKSITVLLVSIAILVVIAAAVYFIVTNTKNNIDNGKYGNKVIYNKYTFQKQQDSWIVELSIKSTLYDIPFYYNPYQVENVTIDPDVFTDFKNYLHKNPSGLAYVTFAPNESAKAVIGGVEVARILGTKYNIFNLDVRSALTYIPENMTAASPIITCYNASDEVLVVFFTSGEENRISSFNNCIVVMYKDVNESIKVADALTFRLLTITRDPEILNITK